MSRTQWREKSGVGKAAETDATALPRCADAAAGTAQSRTLDGFREFWSAPGTETVAAAMGRDSELGELAQQELGRQALQQWQAAAAPTPDARDCAWTNGVQTSNRMQSMPSIGFTSLISATTGQD